MDTNVNKRYNATQNVTLRVRPSVIG